MRRYLRISATLAFFLALPGLVGLAVGLPVAPPPRAAAPDGLPNKEHRLPVGELTPGQIVILEDAGDAADWGHASLDVPAAWKVTKGKGIKVAVLDTGVDHEHRDLKNQIIASKDFTGSRSGDSDVQGHGSHCHGVVGAEENGVGMVGVAPECKLINGKVLGDRGSGLSTGIAAGIDWAVEQGADVISMSLGSDTPDSRIHAAIKRAHAKGVIVVCAAGNEGPGKDTIGYPGGHPESVCVGAVDDRDNLADFSSRGPQMHVAAPGVNVRSCYPGDRFAVMSGTSMATPYVAGTAALWCAAHPEVKKTDRPTAFKAALQATSRDLPPAGRDTGSGFGLVAAGKLVGKEPPKKDPEPPTTDRIIMDFGPGVDFLGRKLKRVIYEFEPVKK